MSSINNGSVTQRSSIFKKPSGYLPVNSEALINMKSAAAKQRNIQSQNG